MSFDADLKSALAGHVDQDTDVAFMRGWRRNRTGPWKGAHALPVALVLHHTAGAATDSTDPDHPGNAKGANDGIIEWVQSAYPVPASSFTLDRDGSLYVHAAQPIWHAGLGTFAGRAPWSALGIPADDANRWTLGVEIVSKGIVKDFTKAQKATLVGLIRACADAARWGGTGTLRLPRHRDWAPFRKPDILYDNSTVQRWVSR